MRNWLRFLRPQRRSQQAVILYTRAGCHLCDDAKEILLRYFEDTSIEEVDIDGDPELRAKYGMEIPVVVIDGVVRFRGRVNEVLLRRLIAS